MSASLSSTGHTPGHAPWYDRLTDEQRARYFPRGQVDVDEFLDRVAERERYGIPAKCTDPATLLRVARIIAGAAQAA